MLAVLVAGVGEWVNAAWDGPGLAAAHGGETVVLIAPGVRTHGIAQILHDNGTLRYPLVFEINARVRGLSGKLKAGEYAIPSRATMRAIAQILVDGKSIQHKLTVAEGLTSDMAVKLVAADPVLVGEAGRAPEEGSLLPETYLFTRGETREGLLDKMTKAQAKFLDTQWNGRAQNLPLKSPREALILASIVEKETALPQERRHIAAVFLNRLRIGMRLQTDPTVIYGLTRGYPLGRGIRQSELDGATPYNTYVIAGLPPGPICNPGKDAIAAVLNPEQSDDLFFVATGRGGHVFASSIAEQARNVAAYRAFERRQSGAAPDPGPAKQPSAAHTRKRAGRK
ncbi:MAG TPA: endolytic transglycosylase MltG [Rhizomicrobium sp.]|nr:endolytic transglycosylase MltG [Rhizomicrobium sp.]